MPIYELSFTVHDCEVGSYALHMIIWLIKSLFIMLISPPIYISDIKNNNGAIYGHTVYCCSCGIYKSSQITK